MDIYTLDGNIIRKFPNGDGTCRVELELMFSNPVWSRLYAIVVFHVAFWQRLGIDYAIANYSGTQVVVRQADFSPAAQQLLIDTLMAAKASSNALWAYAETTLFGQAPGEQVETNRLELLKTYEVTKWTCGTFLEGLPTVLHIKI
ncbi:MAG: hypothetical protein K2Y28_03410 [Burkholderiaceae bacterium]|nr:hypothetical protein [Burkholderiaceae bacterium]